MPLTTDAQNAIARARQHSFGPMGDILKLLADAAEIANAATMSISADGQKAVARAKAESFGDDEDVRKLLAAVAEGLAAGGGGGGGGDGSGSVISVAVATANGVSGTVANPTTTPVITLALGAITPSSVNTANLTIGTYTEGVTALGTVTTSRTLSLASGTVLTATLTASTACVFTMPAPTAGKSFVLLLKQAAATGLGSASFTGVKWPGGTSPVITAAAGKMDILTFVANGTSWFGTVVSNFTP